MYAAAFVTFAILGWFYFGILRQQAVEYGGKITGFNAREIAAASAFTFAVLMSALGGIFLFDALFFSTAVG